MAKDTSAGATTGAPARTIVYLGNRNGIEVLPDPDKSDGSTIRQKISKTAKKRCTTVVLAPGTTLLEAAVQITDPARGVWRSHSDDPAPAWVASTDPALAQLLAAQYGCEVRDPEPDESLVGDQEG